MNLLVVGNGGREHALAWRLAQSDRVTKVFVAPGNAGTALTPRLENLPITDIDQLIEFVKSNNIAFTVVGPEAPLAAGIVDKFRAAGLRIFGPTKAAAQLESSKDFAKAFMKRHNIPDGRLRILHGSRSRPRLRPPQGRSDRRQGRRPCRRQGRRRRHVRTGSP